jgi:hypothetical protein
VEREDEPQTVELGQEALAGSGQVVADLGVAVEVAPERDRALQLVAGFVLERVEGHGRHGRHEP